MGLGNLLLGDDGVGPRVVEAVRARLAAGSASVVDGSPFSGAPASIDAASVAGGGPSFVDLASVDVELDCLAVGGLTLMERLVGYRRAILVDAMVTGQHRPGAVRRFALAEIPDGEATHLDAAHDASLAVALEAGRALGADLPTEITVVAVEAGRVNVLEERLSPEVEAAIPRAVEAILAAIGETGA